MPSRRCRSAGPVEARRGRDVLLGMKKAAVQRSHARFWLIQPVACQPSNLALSRRSVEVVFRIASIWRARRRVPPAAGDEGKLFRNRFSLGPLCLALSFRE